jgi:hypothetical protein
MHLAVGTSEVAGVLAVHGRGGVRTPGAVTPAQPRRGGKGPFKLAAQFSHQFGASNGIGQGTWQCWFD